MDKYSFLTTIYRNAKVDEMKISIASMVGQTVQPEQIVIVIDGPIGEDLQIYVDQLAGGNQELYTIVPLDVNVGQGLAARAGMEKCRNELIARMDADDICMLNRCEKQLRCFENDAELSVSGSNMSEFVGDISNVVATRVVPENHEDICNYLKSRCPMNNISIMFKKSAVEKAGGYMHWHYNEDGYLWARMFLTGAKFYNLQEVLVSARVGVDMYKRRGGWKYYKSERDLYKFMRKNKIINWIEYVKAKYIRLIVQVLMPNFLRGWIFKKFARS